MRMTFGKNRGRKKGRKEKEVEIMFAMYKNGIPMNQIASIVRMDIEEVRKLIGE